MASNQSNYGLAQDSVRDAIDSFMESYHIVDAIVERAIELAPTAKIKDAISVEYVKSSSGNGTSTAKIKVDLGIAPEARAYEYGSGEHSRRGNAARYPIQGNPKLTFFWEKLNKTVSLSQVMHPGVEAKPSANRGYMATAIQETKSEMNGRVQAEFGNLVSKAIRIAFYG